MNTLKRFFNYINEYLRRRRELKELRDVKAKALFLAEKNNQRYYVLPDWNGKLRAVTREAIKVLKKKGIMAKGVNIYHLDKEALFIADPPVIIRKVKYIS